MDLELKSVRKRWKDKAFAVGVNRDIILQGCQRLGMELDDVITMCITAMRRMASQIGL